MPRTYPLPTDPQAAEKVLRRRKQVAAAVTRWRKRHPAAARAISRHTVSLWRISKRYRAERHAMGRTA